MKKSHVLLITVILFCAPGARADDTKQPAQKPTTSVAANTLVHAVYIEGGDASYILSGIEALDFHGIKCIKGSHVDQTWVRNRVIYIPIAKIIAILEYESFDQYKRDMETAQKELLK